MRNQRMGRLAVAAAMAALAWVGGERPASAQETKISGRVFADFTDKENKDDGTGTKSSDSGVGTDVKRFYVGISHSFDDVWSASFVSDIGDKGAKRYDLFVKKAFLQAKLSPQAIFQLGSSDTPWVPYAESLYGYRYVENELLDRLGFGVSADWGAHFLGRSGGDAVLNYQLSALNGRGYSDPTRSKGVDFEGRIGFQPVKGFNLGVGAYSGKRGLDTDAVPARHTATRVDAAIGYVGDRLRIGGEYFRADDWNTVTSAASDKSDGFSGWISFAIAPRVAVFGRYDDAQPSKDLRPNLKDQYYNAGIELRINKAFQAALAYKHERVRGGTLAVSAGTVGSTVATAEGKYDEFGLWTVYTF
jgi:hypothetical protein